MRAHQPLAPSLRASWHSSCTTHDVRPSTLPLSLLSPYGRRVCDRAPPTHFPSWVRCQASTALTYQQVAPPRPAPPACPPVAWCRIRLLSMHAYSMSMHGPPHSLPPPWMHMCPLRPQATIAGASYGHPSRERQCRSSSSTARQAVSICARSTPPGSCRLSATGGVSGATNLSGSSGEPRLEQARNGVWGCCAALSSHARWVPWCCTQRTGLPDAERGRCVASRLAIVLSSRKRQSSVGNVKQTQLTIPQHIRTYTRHPARTNILYVSTTHSIPE